MGSVSSVNSLPSSLSSGGSSSSALDVSSILQAAFGSASSGIDVTSAVNAGVATARQAENTWTSQLSLLQSQYSALSSIQGDAENLQNDLQALNLFSGPLSQMTVSSSNSGEVTASASMGAVAGTHVVVVNNLATTASWTSDPVAGSSSMLAAGSFSITTANGNSTKISTGTGSSTLADVGSQINAANLGLTASVITDANGARLAIVSNTPGAAANFTVTPESGGALGFAQAVAGQNASVTVDGIPIASATNQLSDSLAGLKINLLSANPGVEVTLSVSPDTSQAATALNRFVSDYNTLIAAVNNQFAFVNSSQGVLATDSSIRSLQTAMQNATGYTWTSSSGTTFNLASFGISLNNDGTLSVDSSTLNSALQNNLSDLQNFFIGTSLSGFAATFNNQLSIYTSAADGAFTVDLSSMQAEEQNLELNITNYENNVIAPLQSRLQTEYSNADAVLQQLPAETQQINALLGYYSTKQ